MRGTFIATCSALVPLGELGPPTSQSPAVCWGKKQWTNLILVRLSCSIMPSIWNLTWRAALCLLIPAVPEVKARLIEEALRRLWLPSTPTMEPDMVVFTPLRYLRKRSARGLSADSCSSCTAVLEFGLSLLALSHPLAL